MSRGKKTALAAALIGATGSYLETKGRVEAETARDTQRAQLERERMQRAEAAENARIAANERLQSMEFANNKELESLRHSNTLEAQKEKGVLERLAADDRYDRDLKIAELQSKPRESDADAELKRAQAEEAKARGEAYKSGLFAPRGAGSSRAESDGKIIYDADKNPVGVLKGGKVEPLTGYGASGFDQEMFDSAEAAARKEAEDRAGVFNSDANDFKDDGGSRAKFINRRALELYRERGGRGAGADLFTQMANGEAPTNHVERPKRTPENDQNLAGAAKAVMQGKSRAAVKQALLERGYSEDEIRAIGL